MTHGLNAKSKQEERESPPPWFKNALDSTPEKILASKNFESPELYEKLGIRMFKKYMPTTGDLMYKYVWKKLGASNQVTLNTNSIESALSSTKGYEILHYAFLAVFSILMCHFYESDNMAGLTASTSLNTLINVYPIMLQRYNRMRLTDLRNVMGKRFKKE